MEAVNNSNKFMVCSDILDHGGSQESQKYRAYIDICVDKLDIGFD